jgi:hypothetical protein
MIVLVIIAGVILRSRVPFSMGIALVIAGAMMSQMGGRIGWAVGGAAHWIMSLGPWFISVVS